MNSLQVFSANNSRLQFKKRTKSQQARSHGVAWGGKCYSWETVCQLLANPGNFLQSLIIALSLWLRRDLIFWLSFDRSVWNIRNINFVLHTLFMWLSSHEVWKQLSDFAPRDCSRTIVLPLKRGPRYGLESQVLSKLKNELNRVLKEREKRKNNSESWEKSSFYLAVTSLRITCLTIQHLNEAYHFVLPIFHAKEPYLHASEFFSSQIFLQNYWTFIKTGKNLISLPPTYSTGAATFSGICNKWCQLQV